MKRILFTIGLLFQCLYLFSQSSVLQVKQDSVKVRNAELVIENSTKGIPGVLLNTGNGTTEFRKIQLKNLGDTALAIVGQDTLRYSGFGGASGKSVQFKAGISQGYPVAGDSIYINPDFTSRNVKVWRNGSFQYRDLNDGILVDSTIGKITFRPALTQGERVYIEAMSGISLVFIYPPAGFFTNLTQLNAGAFDHGNNTFTLRWATNNNTLSLSPRVVGLGSSTLAGYGLNAPDRLGDKIGAWFNSNTSGASWNNLAVGGYSSVNLLPVSQGGTAGTNIDSALKYNPDFIFVSLPSNDVANGLSNAAVLANLRKLDTMALNKGIPILWETTQPREQLNAAQQTQLKVIADSIRAIWPKRFVEGFNNLVNTSAPTDAVTRTEYAYGDGIHLNALGVLQIANSLFARFQSYFQPIQGVSGYVIEASANGSSWSQFDEVTNPVIVKKSYTKPSGGLQYFRVKANYTNGTSSPYSNIATYFGNGGGTTPTVFVSDASVTLPTNSVALTGNVNANGSTITGYQWTQISGPNTATMGTNTAVNCTMGGLVSGSYVFRLTVTVSGGATYSDDATVSVNTNPPPTVTVADANITLPTNSVQLTGNITANGNSFSGYQWTQVSGPNTATMGTPTATSCTMSGLTNGVYVFRLTATVNGGATYSDDATVTVNASSGTAPTIAVADASITLPTSSVSLTSTINANGNTITGYQWTQLSPTPGAGGPNAVTFGTATAANTTVGALTNGVFKVRLTVTVSGGATYSDDATITVLPDNGGLKTLRAYFSNAAAPVIPGWMNLYGAVTGMNISVTDPATSWTINNGGNTNIYWTGLANANAADNAGMVTGNNTGIVPDIALASYWFNYSLKYSTNDNLLITGLNPAKTYTLKLVGSRSNQAASPRYAAWRINGGSELLQNALGNTSMQEVVTGVVPNSSGVIRIAVYPPVNHTTNGEFSYINALIIQEN